MKLLDVTVQYSPYATLDDVQKAYVYQAMLHFNGHKRQACKALGISYPTLYNLLNRYDLLSQFRKRAERIKKS